MFFLFPKKSIDFLEALFIAPRAKDGKRQKWLELDVQATFFKSIVITNNIGRCKPLYSITCWKFLIGAV